MPLAGRARKIRALRALAERPGTPEEGAVARAMLAKLEAVGDQPQERSIYDAIDARASNVISTDEFVDIVLFQMGRRPRAK